MAITYQLIKNATNSDKEELLSMIKDFYMEELHEDRYKGQIQKSVDTLLQHPDYGSIFMFKDGDTPVGYSILVNFYSNEYGGLLLYIDELFVKPEFRGKKISSNFIQSLVTRKDIEFIGLKLEVLPHNTGALRLYEKLGFQISDRTYLMLKK